MSWLAVLLFGVLWHAEMLASFFGREIRADGLKKLVRFSVVWCGSNPLVRLLVHSFWGHQVTTPSLNYYLSIAVIRY